MPKIWAGVPEVFDWSVELIDQTDCRTINANLQHMFSSAAHA